jgi:glycosyltransferase involved in cell wall biosynthesis
VKVSIVIPTYNHARYVGAAIESALVQTCPPSQIIVVDDGSTDETGEVCSRYCSRINYIRQDNAGPSAARNTALQHLSGEAVVFLDSDDILYPYWVGKAIDTYKQVRIKGQKVGIVYGDRLIFDDAGLYQKRIRVRDIHVNDLLQDSLLLPSGTFITKACLDDVGAFNSDLDFCEDWDYWLRAALKGYRFIRVGTLGFKHREHSASAGKQEISAVHARIRFLQHWLKSDSLDDVQKAVVEQELSRTFLRLRRTVYYDGQSADEHLRRALDLDSSISMDPLLFVFGAVYAAPFFRVRVRSEEVRQSIEDLHCRVSRLLEETGRLDSRMIRRLKASAILARGADAILDHRYIEGLGYVIVALGTDPTLLCQAYPNTSRYVAEFRRAVKVL